MKSEIRKIENSKAEIDLVVKWDDVRTSYDTLINKYQAQLTLPGFRKGKAPKDVVEKKIGKDVLKDAAIQAMDETLKKAFDEAEPKLRPLPYSQPEVLNIEKILQFESGKDIEFTTRYEIVPTIELKEYKDIEVEYPNVVISDDMVNAEIERYRNQNAEIKTKEAGSVEKGDLVTIDYTITDGDNQKITDYTFTLGEGQNYYRFDDMLIGMKQGEEKDFKMTYTSENKPEGFTRDEASFKVEVKAVKSKILPEINDEFAQDIKSEYKTVKDMKDGIKKSLTDNLEGRMRNTKAHLIAKAIISKNDDFDVPETMVNFEINSSFNRFASQMGMKSEDLEKFLAAQGQTKAQFTAGWRDDAKANIKEELIISNVEEKEKIEPESEKVEAAIKSQIPENASEEQKKQYEAIIKDNLAYEATIDYLIKVNKLIPSKKEISYEDFASGKYLEDEKEKKTEEK